jgi:predicted alpha/beta-fold hydrolase
VGNPNKLYDCDMWLYDAYDNSVHLDILNNFLPNCEKPILLVYSQNDPWTGARITNVNPVAKLIINPDGIHHQDINNPEHYSPALRQEIIDYIGKYVKLP